jgi:thiol:disulfide interchange protein
VEVRLVARTASVMPGYPLELGVLLSMDPDWHVYWTNPGQTGLPVRVDWHLPRGWSAGNLRWPTPERFETGGIVTYGYSSQVLLTAALTPPSDLIAGSAVEMGAAVSWLACRVECIPGSSQVLLSLPVGKELPSADARWREVFSAAIAALPSADPSVHANARASAGAIVLDVKGWKGTAAHDARFYPAEQGMADDSSTPAAALSDGTLRVTLRVPAGVAAPLRLCGVLVAGGDRKAGALEIDAPVTGSTGNGGLAGVGGLWLALLLAMVGGMILNVMPCVLPVLSLKVIALARGAQENGTKSLFHGLLYGAGVIASFLALGGILVGLRSAGRLIGWGFLFQDPVVVAVTAMLFFLVSLNLLGVFEVAIPMGRLGNVAAAGARNRMPGLASFLSGLFAAAVATPCTAPFMAAALGYALSQTAPVALGVFAALGIGMSAPFVVLSAFPRLGARLPRPGRWMETLRQLMGFPMLAAVVWMLFVESALLGASSVVRLAGAMVAAGFGAWLWGRWGQGERTRGTRRAVGAVAAVVVIGAVLFASLGAAGARHGPPAESALAAAPGSEAPWGPWSQARVEEARAQGRPVFIDFTARWCLTCQVNEGVALDNAAVLRELRNRNVLTLRADWTDGNRDIAAALAGYGRAGVPVYVLYRPDSDEPQLLPEILTPGIVLDAIAALR